jgi:flagellar biosynthesis protein FlhA
MASVGTSQAGFSEAFARIKPYILPAALILSLLVILVPLPAMLMDMLLAGNVTVAVLVLLTTIYVRTPLEFSVFPSLLLATTLARLVLNVATTRMILTRADADGMLAAGAVVKNFGEFVAGDTVVVGLIIFVIIVLIQFLVITKGATRISEVAARFALDGMPGRQMAIDADLNAGIIDEREAQRRRAEITQQADFFGAMDGASKFVRGDAIAGIIITLINVIGGLVIGLFSYGMSLGEAANLFTKLTIGDGLVSQIPAFLTSLAAGLLVTRSTQKINLPVEFLNQLFSRPQALMVTGAFLGILIFTSLPAVPLVVLGGGCVGLAFILTDRRKKDEAQLAEREKQEEAKPAEERIEDFLSVDPMEIEIGVSLIRLADPKRGGDLLDRIQRIRRQVAADLGIIMPKVRIRDNMQLEQNQYRIKITDVPVATGTAYPGMIMAMNAGVATGRLSGIHTKEPLYETDATWIDQGQRDQAEMLGYTVVEPATVLATHLTEVVRQHADELLTRDSVKHLVEQLKETSPATVNEVVGKQMDLHEVQGVLQRLLGEGVSIRNLGTILETLGEYGGRTKDPILLTEYVRHRLARAICAKYRDKDNKLRVVTLEPALEDRIRAGFDHNDRGIFVRMSPAAIETTCRLIARESERLAKDGKPQIVLVSPQIRAALKQMTEPHLPRLIVLSYNEITRDTRIESIGMVMEARAAA